MGKPDGGKGVLAASQWGLSPDRGEESHMQLSWAGLVVQNDGHRSARLATRFSESPPEVA